MLKSIYQANLSLLGKEGLYIWQQKKSLYTATYASQAEVLPESPPRFPQHVPARIRFFVNDMVF